MSKVCSEPIETFIEIGKKKTFAGAIDWPGWCRSGRDEQAALRALIEYGNRYALVMEKSGIEFAAPDETSALQVRERHAGTVSTDFGAPAIVLEADRASMDREDYERARGILEASWQAFDDAVQAASGKALRKGPRGGGRDLGKVIEHVIEADRQYLMRLAWKHERESGIPSTQELNRTRQAILNALQVAEEGALPKRGPRGGVIWTPRYYVRRVAWHVLDHAWEIEDRVTV